VDYVRTADALSSDPPTLPALKQKMLYLCQDKYLKNYAVEQLFTQQLIASPLRIYVFSASAILSVGGSGAELA
jgi:hypothetical protein